MRIYKNLFEKEKILDTEEVMKKIENIDYTKNKNIKNEEEFWKEKALKDPLTKLPNRLASDLILDYIKDKCKYIAVIDIDYFKNINDTYGHQVGDVVLNKLASFLKEKLIVTRFGGEEFVCFLVGDKFKDDETVVEYLNNLREQISELKFDKVDKDEKITVSIGVTKFSKDKKMSMLFKEADKALYCAKDYGRNQVVFYEEGMDCEAHNDDGENLIKNAKCNKNMKNKDRLYKIAKHIKSLTADELKQLNSLISINSDNKEK